MAWPSISGLSSWWTGEKKDLSCRVNGRQIGLVEAIISDIFHKTLNLETATLPQLQWLKNVIDSAQVRGHPIVKKIHDAIQKYPGFYSSPLRQTHRTDAFAAMQLQESLVRSRMPGQIEIATRFSQNDMTIEQVTAVIQERGGHLQDLELTEVNDKLLGLIAKKCPGLISLSINQRRTQDQLWCDFTDEGLGHIAELYQLTRLNLSIWESLQISRPALQKLLNSEHLSQNCKDLKLITYLVNNDVLKVIASYRQLETFHVTTASISAPGIEAFIGSSSIQATLRSLSLSMGGHWGTLVTNNVLTSLLKCTLLQELTLNGKWDISDQNLQTLLKYRNCLTKLCLTGVALSSADAAQIAEMKDLAELFIGNASSLTENDFSGMLLIQNKPNLRAFGVTKGVNLTVNNILQLTYLPNLHHLAFIDCGSLMHGLTILCNSHNMQTNLRYLEIIHNKWITGKAFAEIGKLPLTCLRIEDCLQFNDDSLEGILKGRAKDMISELGLSRVFISNSGLVKLGQLKQLRTLMINMCGAITESGWTEFLKQQQLQERLRKLFLNFAITTPTMIKLFEAFKELGVLIVGNPVEMDNHFGDFYRLENLKRRNAKVGVFVGEHNGGWSELIKA